MSAISADVPAGLKKIIEVELERGYLNSQSELIRDAIRRLAEEHGLIESHRLSDDTVAAINAASEKRVPTNRSEKSPKTSD